MNYVHLYHSNYQILIRLSINKTETTNTGKCTLKTFIKAN